MNLFVSNLQRPQIPSIIHETYIIYLHMYLFARYESISYVYKAWIVFTNVCNLLY
jgi:hypothetical protein